MSSSACPRASSSRTANSSPRVATCSRFRISRRNSGGRAQEATFLASGCSIPLPDSVDGPEESFRQEPATPCPCAGGRRRVCRLFNGKAEQSPDGGVAGAGDRAGQLPISTTANPTASAFIGIKATAKPGVTEKQLRPALPIPNGKTMPCASGADYAPGPPVQVDVFFLKGATTADQNASATTMRSSGMFAVVTVQPPP